MSERPDWQVRFLSTTNRVSFQLNLTRCMLEFLCAISDDVRWDRDLYPTLFEPDNWIATSTALLRRGLIERKPRVLVPEPQCGIQHWRTTPVGSAVCEMLKIGGLFIQAEAAREKLAKRKGRN